jgi:hypothetical protein
VCHACLATTAFALLPASLGAEQLNLGARAEAFWADNAGGGTQQEEEDETSVRVNPWGDVSDREGDLTWGLRYAPSYEYYFDQSDLRGFDHDVGGRMEWALTPTTRLRVSDRFQRYHSVHRFNDETDPAEEVNIVGERDRFKRNVFSTSLDRSLSPRDLVSLSLFHTYQDNSDEFQRKHNTLGSAIFFRRLLSERTSIGSRLSWTRQTFERNEIDDQETDYYNLSGTLTHAFDRTFRMDLSAGPALIQSDAQDVEFTDVDLVQPGVQLPVVALPLRQEGDVYRFIDADSCRQDNLGNRILGPKCETFAEPTLTQSQFRTFQQINRARVSVVGDIPSVDDTNVTYFASLALTKEWQYWQARLAYNRSYSDATSVAAVSDNVLGSLSWQIARRWRAELNARYERRQQATENLGLATVVSNVTLPPPQSTPAARTQALRPVKLDSDAAIDYVTLNLRLIYQLTQRSSLYAKFIFRDQSQTGDVELLNETERFGVAIGINHVFDPISF